MANPSQDWRARAHASFPEFREELEDETGDEDDIFSIYSLFSELEDMVRTAHRDGDDDLLRRIYGSRDRPSSEDVRLRLRPVREEVHPVAACPGLPSLLVLPSEGVGAAATASALLLTAEDRVITAGIWAYVVIVPVGVVLAAIVLLVVLIVWDRRGARSYWDE